MMNTKTGRGAAEAAVVKAGNKGMFATPEKSDNKA